MNQTNQTEILVAGSCMIDLVSYVESLPKAGETVFGTSFLKSYGGKGANQSVACALLGLNTSFCGRIGDDEFGNDYCKNLLSHQINITHLHKTLNELTGVASISVDSNGVNTIVITPSSNSLVSVNDIKDAVNEISTSKILICQNEIPYLATLEAVKIASRQNTLVIFNPAPAKPLRDLREVLTLCDIICPNETELSTLTGLPVATMDEIITAGKFLLTEAYCINTILVVTLGENGALIIRKIGKPAILHVSIPEEYKAVAVDTVGKFFQLFCK